MLKLYDILESNGVFNEIIKAIPEKEYLELIDYMDEVQADLMTYGNSVAGVVSDVINNLPKNAQVAMDMVDNFDKDKYSEVVNFANAIGMKSK